jgi:hypothetical protein
LAEQIGVAAFAVGDQQGRFLLLADDVMGRQELELMNNVERIMNNETACTEYVQW